MILKKYKYVSRIKFVRIELNWSAGDSFCSEVAGCKLSDRRGECKYNWIHERCSIIGMDSKQNRFSYIPQDYDKDM